MPQEELESAVGPIPEINEDALGSVKEAYKAWKANQTDKTPPRADLSATGGRDELPGDFIINCTAAGHKIPLSFCRTECELINSYRDCPDYLG
jgi:hypothetical protein